VIGGGIAGCTVAAALARRGWRVTLCERHASPAAEASGNPQAIIFPRLAQQASPLARINLAALLYASRFYSRFWERLTGATFRLGEHQGERCGVLVLPEQPADTDGFQRIAARYQRASDFVRLASGKELRAIAGVALKSTMGLYFPRLGWIRPAAVCAKLCEHPNIRIEHTDIADLEWDERAQQWLLADQQGRTGVRAPVVILANGLGATRFAATDWLPLKTVRGQISAVRATVDSSRLQTILCGAGYLAPAEAGVHTLGATYAIGDCGTDVRDADHGANLVQLAATDAVLPAVLNHPQIAALSGRAALRCTSPDYLPLVGPAPRRQEFLTDYAALRRDARTAIPLAGQYWPGLYLSCAHGSRGMAYAPLGAELLASQIHGGVLPLERELSTALNPARFLIRALKRRTL
jgi:tRNA 5-methylaminomethyl-2-thiouridine biosynthesis bifunctional protein